MKRKYSYTKAMKQGWKDFNGFDRTARKIKSPCSYDTLENAEGWLLQSTDCNPQDYTVNAIETEVRRKARRNQKAKGLQEFRDNKALKSKEITWNFNFAF